MLDELLNHAKGWNVTEDKLDIAAPEPEAVPSTTTVDITVVTNEMPPHVDVRVKSNDARLLAEGLLRPFDTLLDPEKEVLREVCCEVLTEVFCETLLPLKLMLDVEGSPRLPLTEPDKDVVGSVEVLEFDFDADIVDGADKDPAAADRNEANESEAAEWLEVDVGTVAVPDKDLATAGVDANSDCIDELGDIAAVSEGSVDADLREDVPAEDREDVDVLIEAGW
ncbi:hypothetical protein EJ03DRAFT_374582 [Teratosphaeria nubilosa]|uniref:Uncharacterized protein n=1 Tax=Teratosphaeria nubilosa TaxID=161662 RepID=A0A6G1L9W7_9PEZI|nr:hypothetical protein EJ03DRAFT_374582 [Teratosphaeria nubilosa]